MSKPNVMLLTTRQMLSHMTDTDLNVRITPMYELLQCNNIKYLGVDIDNVLSWDIQTDSSSKKLFFIISRLSRLKPVFLHICLCIFIRALSNRKLTMQYRYGAIRPHIILTNPAVAKQSCKNIDGNYENVNTRCIYLVKTLGLMNVSQRRDYFMIMLMFKSIHGLVQRDMQRDVAERTIRSTIDNNVHAPHITLECCKNAFAYRGPVLWNALPENIKKCESLNGFKQCFKLHVVE